MNNKLLKQYLTLSLIILVGFLFRIYFLNLPAYDNVYYDEAIPGLMAIDILEGKFPIFYWGAPYIGSLESIIASIFFYFFGISTLTLRLSPFLFFIIFAFFLYKIAQKNM
ncbi:hypothetical protein BVX93_02210 [bacterium B13(2017)]|nr:hypothetical protein BVX93_02210 [bacterium B13(2017)]